MAACTRTIAKVLSRCHRHTLPPCGQSLTSFVQRTPQHLPVRTFAAAKSATKETQRKKQKDEKPKVRKERIIDNTNRHKPYGFTAWAPVDDVYMVRYYPRPVYDVGVAIDMLKEFQRLEFTEPDQPVYLNLKLDMKLEKKKKVDPFVSTVHLPHPFKTEPNRVVVFTEDPDQAKVAEENGATLVGGPELIQKILDDEIQADFYVAVPDIVSKLVPLKNKLRKKFPKTKRGSVGVNIPNMLELFKKGHEYLVERDCYIVTQIAVLDMPKEQILANIETIIKDVCTHRPASFGPFVERAIINSVTSEALHFNCQQFLPVTKEEESEAD
ncbi:39S ribosomal protein L1, mitochondrial [Megalops cyprinoides]|uniref:39S ribosomal protein L1, mitochondrial n=1 Tax=Megalops cyprinoides TaxID=118141 RepID=UPI001863FA5C|nr:39S ribosomal protein L1, mitochondrial [Megalops cyprinoides]